MDGPKSIITRGRERNVIIFKLQIYDRCYYENEICVPFNQCGFVLLSGLSQASLALICVFSGQGNPSDEVISSMVSGQRPICSQKIGSINQHVCQSGSSR